MSDKWFLSTSVKIIGSISSNTLMATTFSSVSHLRSVFYASIAPKTRPSLPDFKNVRSWSASANYVDVKLHAAARAVSAKAKRIGVRCATLEEIEEEKSMIEEDARERMEKTIDNVRASFNSIRTGRANPAILDKIEVEYYGTPVVLKSIAQISTPDASSILVQPYDKSSLKSIEKAIVNSDLGMTPNNDGDVIRLSMPQLTSDRRKELSKVVAKQAEEGKVAIRNIRRDAIKSYEKLEKEKKLSEDNVKDLSADLQKVTDEYMKKIESIFKQKEKELLQV
ncbi:ribosome-recycling factor, chloroplastic-like [Salvia splendens]|uniref:ribosome-recycling factor, chloroplastic-like n=1 Tax=Salvia splendens TaxID=180675 RepID=UPI001C273255|nr:ribosome-recycling factor, chloroplastic-like [Salvia splendens]